MSIGSDLEAPLAAVFGFRRFRPHQEDIVRAVLGGQDVFAVMPTGGGKSLCYQLPAHLLPGVCIVVSPLISLMKDQVDAARGNGLRAASLNSTTASDERQAIASALRAGEMDLLYVSPERFNAAGFSDWLKSLPLSFFAIDEAHCISEWGHDFRPDYLALSRIVSEFPGVPIAAFTATATPQVSQDIALRLGLRAPHLVRASFDRPNLFYQVTPKEDLDRQLLELLQSRADESGIIYRTTRKSVDATAAMLRKNGLPARAYHAGLPDEERAAVQEAFRRDECPVIVATIAFGMGIDKPNVRYVVHGDLPKNIEGYYQETGRAGRDGEPARCVLFFGRQDIAQLARFAAGVEEEHAREIAQSQLRQMAGFAENDGCRRTALLRYFGETYPAENCGGCDVCAGEVEREDASVEAQKALSAIARTGGRFGAGHLVDILTGADTERIRQQAHNQLPTYGVGKDRDKTYWRRVYNALQAQGLTGVEDPQYPVPFLTEAGRQVMRGQATFAMLKQAPAKAQRAGRGGRAEVETACSGGLFACLKQERTRRAQVDNVPPYVVFPDRTLRELAARFPVSSEQMLAIGGIGQHKLRTYGEAFLAVIRQYRTEHPEDDPAQYAAACAEGAASGAGAAVARSKDAADKASRPAAQQVLARLGDGWTPEQIAQERGCKVDTVIDYMDALLQAGHALQPERYLESDKLAEIERRFRADGSWRLTPVVEPGGVTYAEARLARLILRPREDNAALSAEAP